MRCNTHSETKLDGGGLLISDCSHEADLDGKCYMCLYENLQKESEAEVLRVKLRNSELVDAVLYLKELLYAADAIIGEERLASAKITWISTAVVELKQAQEDTDKKAEAGNG